MAKSHNQKAKILILEHLLAGTSRDRVVTMQEILDKLAEYEITAERKSIYDDLEALREFGLDIEFKRGRPGGYYLMEMFHRYRKNRQQIKRKKLSPQKLLPEQRTVL